MRCILNWIGLLGWLSCLTQTAYAQPQAAFGSPLVEICAPAVVQLTDQSTSSGTAIVQWEWLVNGSPFSTLQNPALFLNQPGLYDICLRIEDALGQRDTLCQTAYFTAFRSPQVRYGISTTEGCAPLLVHFTDSTILGDAPIRQWRWDFGDGQLDTLQASPSHLYTTTGTFDVTLVVIDTNGCSDALLRSNAITVRATPTASIAQSTFQPFCDTPATVTFTAQSSVQGATYSWDMGDNTTAVGGTVAHQYLNTGCFSPTLTVNNGGCTVTVTTTNCITVTPPVEAAFDIDDTTHCQVPFGVQFTNRSSNATNYSWSFGDSTFASSTNPSHTYLDYYSSDPLAFSPGLFPVVLVASNGAGCIDRDTQFIYVSLVNATIMPSGSARCAPDTFQYISVEGNISPIYNIVDRVWSIENGLDTTGRLVSAYYPDSGVYQLQLIVTDNIGCRDTSYYRAEVGIPVQLDSVTVDRREVCRIEQVTFTGYGSSYIDRWDWLFSDNSIEDGQIAVHNFIDTGRISGVLFASFRGCTDSLQLDTITVLPPAARFNINIDCGSLTVTFDNLSLGADSVYWDFGDTTTTQDTSTLYHPTYTYPAQGIYRARLIVYNFQTGCADTMTLPVNLTLPQALFEVPDSLCAPTSFLPINRSTNALLYRWAKPGSITIPFDTAFIYQQSGTFSITLYASNILGCTDSSTQIIQIAGIAPNIVHQPIPACRPATVTFIDSSIGILSPIVSRQWGNGSTASTLTQVYPFPGPQIMPLQVTNAWGCVFQLEDTVQVGGAFINFNSVRDVCLGNSTNLIAITSSPANANAFRPFIYAWDFGDGTRDTTTSEVVFHTYQQTGVFDVCLDVIDAAGCVTTLCKPDWIEVHDPQAQFTSDTFFSSCPPLEVNFNQLLPSGSQWTWSFGDGSTSGLQSPAHVFSTAGFYDIILTVQAFPGCSDSDTIRQMIQIAGPTAFFQSPPGRHCAPHSIQLTASGSNIAQYTWLYGNGDLTTHSNPAPTDTTVYTYTTPGRYAPILVVNDGMGCQLTYAGDTLEIIAPPQAQFVTDSLLCAGASALYQATGATTAWDSLQWNFANGLPASAQSPTISVRYDTAGQYMAQLIVWQEGCSDTLAQPTVQVLPTPQASFQLLRLDSCAPAALQLLQPSGGDSTAQLTWLWDNGNSNTASGDTSWLQTAADTLTIRLLANIANTCLDTSQQTVIFYPLPLAQAGVYPPVCVGDSVTLIGNASASANWWYQGNTIGSASQPLTVQVNGQQTYILEAISPQGCRATDTTTLSALPYLAVSLGDSLRLCAGDSILLGATSNDTLLWSGMAGLSCTQCANPWAAPLQSGYYYAQIDSNYACLQPDSVWVTVLPLPQASILADSSICAGDSLHLQAMGGGTYQWWPSTAVADRTAALTWALPDTATTYLVVVTTLNGCTDTAQHRVYVGDPTGWPLPDSSICIGDSLQLSLPPIAQQVQWQGPGLSCQACPNPTLGPDSSVVLYLSYLNADQCPVSDTVAIAVTDLRAFGLLPVDSICAGDSLWLRAIGTRGRAVQWWQGDTALVGSDSSILVQPRQAGWYSAQLSVERCTAADSLWVNLHPPTQIQAQDVLYCLQDSALLLATGNAHAYHWSPTQYLAQDSGAAVWVYALATTTYQVMGLGRCGADTAVVQVVVQAPPLLQVDSVIEAGLGETITLSANAGGATITWSPSDGLSCTPCDNPTWTVEEDAVFYLTAVDDLGCWAQDSLKVRLQRTCVAEAVFVPSAFSPDGDGHNDQLYPARGGNEQLIQFEIYNRWGERVFLGQDWQQGWDGRFKGAALSPDVYGYYLIFECAGTGERILKKGNITLLR